MNKALFEKVKANCKDYGLSEKYLTAITEKMGGSIEDDSTDENAIEEMANQIADIAKETQGEATRWASKKKPKSNKKDDEPDGDGDDSDDDDGKKTKPKADDNPDDDRIIKLQKELAELKAGKEKAEREALIKAAQTKHEIPDWRMKGLKVPDDADVDEFMADIKQDLITQNLIPASSEGAKAATEKQVDEAADSLLESITAK